MAAYLQICAGPLHLMLCADGVHEVTTLERLGQCERGHVEWREDILPVVSLKAFFELETKTPILPTESPLAPSGSALPDSTLPLVVYSPAEEAPPLALLLDEVVWLRDLPARAWLALPPIPARTRHFFDAVMYFPETGHQAFRLRRPLRSADFRSACAWSMGAAPEPQAPQQLQGLQGLQGLS